MSNYLQHAPPNFPMDISPPTTPPTPLTKEPPSVEQIVSSHLYLNNVSEEQFFICNSIKEGKNVIVDACAGSGKSTTVLSTCRFMPDSNFLILTFNRALRVETREKVNHLNIANAEVHTYHSLAVQYYHQSAHTDNKIMHLIKNKLPLKKRPNKLFDVIVIDEAQDMSKVYFYLIKKFANDLNHPYQLLVLGDYRQCLYEFKGGDVRYLTHSEYIWNSNPLLKNPEDWIYATLKTTYRLTNQMANFVNNVLLGEEKLVACRDGPPVKYFVSTFFKIPEEIYEFINRIVNVEKTGAYDDFFILAPSIKKSVFIKMIENKLVANNIPCHIPLIEDTEMDERIIKNKVVFCTFHSSKGRQRKYVIVLSFDNTYFDYNARNKPRNICPNTIYVATTRATTELYIYEKIRYMKDESPQNTIYSFDFLKLNHPEMQREPYIDFVQTMPSSVPLYVAPADKEMGDNNNAKIYRTSPTDLTKFLSYKTIEKIYPIIDDIWQLEVKDQVELHVPNIIETETGYEDVCDLNGIVIPLIYYDAIYNSNAKVLRNKIAQYLSKKHHNDFFIRQNIGNVPSFCDTADDYLFLANVTKTIEDNLHFRLKQINKSGYNWLTQDIIDPCLRRLNYYIAPNPDHPFEIEVPIITGADDNTYISDILRPHFGDITIYFTAFLDIVTHNTVWELKCTNDISFEHKIQVTVYAWLWQLTYEKTSTNLDNEMPKEFRILNIKSGEVWRLDANIEQLTEIMIVLIRKLIDANDGDNLTDNDQEFIDSHV